MAEMADDVEIDDADLERLLNQDDEDDQDGDGNDPPADWKPPTFAEWKAAQDKATRANSNAKQLRLKFNEYRKQHGPKPAPPSGSGKPGDGEKTKTEAEIRAELAAEFKSKQDAAAVQTEAVTALVAAGLQLPKDVAKRTTAARKAIRLMDLDGVEPGDTAGIAQAIEDLKDEYPGLFGPTKDEDDEDEKPRRKSRQPIGGPGARTTKQDGRPLSNNEMLARALQRTGAFKS